MIADLRELAQTLFEEAGDALFLFDPETERVLEVNPMAQRLSGFGRAQLLSRPITYLFRAERQGGMAVLRRAYSTTGLFHSREGFLLRHERDGVWVPVNITVTRLHARPRTLGLITARDISERKEAERALRDSEARYRTLFEDNPQPLWVFDAETRAFLAVNNAAVDHYGYTRDEFLAMTVQDLCSSAEGPAPADGAADGAPPEGPGVCKHRKKDGTLIDVEVACHALTYGGRPARLVLAHDVTERRRLEEQLRQAQKMEAVGQLAGGVAHDFNNLLTVITGYSDLVLAELDPAGPHHALVAQVRQAAERAAALTRQLLAFSRRQLLKPERLDLNAVLTATGKMLRRLIGEHIELVTDLDPALPAVRADAGQVEQVILNLAVNARDAMPDGGRLVLRTASAEPGAANIDSCPGVRPGHYALLEVIDTGHGMDEATRARVFEPFFTTKGVGRGTGLGLATVYGIVQQSEGQVTVESSPGRGTTFRVYLPAAPAAEAAPEPPAAPPEAEGGTETVLLVEDEEGVRLLARLALERKGYAVLEAAGGKEALALAARHPGPIDLLVTDVVMPGLNGRELADRLAAARPAVKVLYVSGYTNDAILRRGIGEETAALLPKPFSPGALAAKVRRVLDDGPAVAAANRSCREAVGAERIR